MSNGNQAHDVHRYYGVDIDVSIEDESQDTIVLLVVFPADAPEQCFVESNLREFLQAQYAPDSESSGVRFNVSPDPTQKRYRIHIRK